MIWIALSTYSKVSLLSTASRRVVTPKEWLPPLHNSDRRWTKRCRLYSMQEVAWLRSTISKQPPLRHNHKTASIKSRWCSRPNSSKFSKARLWHQPLNSANRLVNCQPRAWNVSSSTPLSSQTSSHHWCLCHNIWQVRRQSLTAASLPTGDTSATSAKKKRKLLRRSSRLGEARASKVQQRIKWQLITPQGRTGASPAVRCRNLQIQAQLNQHLSSNHQSCDIHRRAKAGLRIQTFKESCRCYSQQLYRARR